MPEGTRIRYKLTQDGLLITDDLLGGTNLVRGVIIPFERVVKVETLVNGQYEVTLTRQYNGMATAKRFVKEGLKSLGVTFYEEVRAKRRSKDV